MAFSFGASSTPASTGFSFGGSTAAASSGFSFGAASTAAPSSGFSFGAASTPAFGATASTPAGAGSTPAFGFGASTTPAVGASSTPALSFSSTPTTGLFGQTAAQPAPPFGGAFGQPAQQAAQQQVPFTKATKFEELDSATQQKLKQIQDQISKYEQDRQKVMQLEHLQDNTALQQNLDADTSSLSAELRLLQAKIKAEREGLEDFREKAIRLLKATETVVRTYERTKLWRDAPAMIQRQQPLKPAQQELLNQPVMLPGPFLAEAVSGFSSSVAEYSRVLEEVEQVLAAASMQDLAAQQDVNWVMALPTVVSNLHDYFVAVAAKLEHAHTEVQKLKAAYLARLRSKGITADPFERARRQEQQQQQLQQQRVAAAAVAAVPGTQQLGLPAPSAAGTGAPIAAAPAAGGLFGASPQPAPATPAALPAPGFGATPFGSPFVSAGTPSPFGGGAGANGSLSRSNSKARAGKKR